MCACSHMVDEERCCIDILTQVSGALDRLAVGMVDGHRQHCVAGAVRAGDGDAQIRDPSATVGRFLSG